MRTPAFKHSVVLFGRCTSVRLEEDFWRGLQEIAGEGGKTVKQLIADIAAERKSPNLASAIRTFVLGYYRDRPINKVRANCSNILEHAR